MDFRNRLSKTSIFLFLLLFLGSCESPLDPITDPTDLTTNSESVPTIIPTGDEQYLNTKSDFIYDQSELRTFELTIPTEDYEKINNDPAAEQYVAGSLNFENETISPVGIRYKGSIGAFVGCLSNFDLANPSGSKTCTKLSMKVKINWEGREEKFYGLKKLQFHSMNNDPSQLRERVAYHCFREMGVAAPRAVHARLVINGEFVGLFALVEQIDGRFTRHNFEDGKGNLYKELWPLNSAGQARTSADFLNALKTNEDENPTVDLIQNFAQQIAAASSENVPAIIEEYMDIETMIAYAAVDRTIRNDDGAFHWYCGDGSCDPHNFYWYEETDRQKVHLIPWDTDHAFENIVFDANPIVPIADDWGETRNDCEPFGYGVWRVQQKSAACDKLTAGWVTYADLYEQKRQEFIETVFSAAQLEPLMTAWEAQISTATEEAKAAHGDAVSLERWKNAVTQLRTQIERAREL
ncbi:MAG: CotH kinase family protein [Saprospiraceae bacterium]